MNKNYRREYTNYPYQIFRQTFYPNDGFIQVDGNTTCSMIRQPISADLRKKRPCSDRRI